MALQETAAALQQSLAQLVHEFAENFEHMLNVQVRRPADRTSVAFTGPSATLEQLKETTGPARAVVRAG